MLNYIGDKRLEIRRKMAERYYRRAQRNHVIFMILLCVTVPLLSYFGGLGLLRLLDWLSRP